jgi:hypothetical protein
MSRRTSRNDGQDEVSRERPLAAWFAPDTANLFSHINEQVETANCLVTRKLACRYQHDY